MSMRRIRLLLLAMMGRGYPPVVFIQPGENPTLDRREMIQPINVSLIITIVVMAIATPALALFLYPKFFPPKTAAAITPDATIEATMESTAESTIEPTASSTPTPIVIVVTATPTATFTPTATPTATFTATPTATNTAVDIWPVWMTATRLYEALNPSSTPAVQPPLRPK